MTTRAELEIVVRAAVEAAIQSLGEMGDSVEGVGEATVEAGEKAKGGFKVFGLSLTDLKSGIDMVTGRLRQMAEAVKAVFEFGKLGAQVRQTKESFEGLRAEMGLDVDYLRQLQDAHQGTIADLESMSGLLTLTAGTSKEFGAELANIYPRMIEYAKAASKLNPALGDTSFMLESISTGVKRQSKLILDNLGIVFSQSKANEDYARSIGKAADALNDEERQMAFLNATMEAGDRLIEQVGGTTTAATDEFEKMEVQLQNSQREMAEKLMPTIANVVEGLRWVVFGHKDVGRAMREQEGRMRATAESWEEYNEEMNRLRVTGVLFTERLGAMSRVQWEAMDATRRHTEAIRDDRRAVVDWTGWSLEVALAAEFQRLALDELSVEHHVLAQATEDDRLKAVDWTKALEAAAEAEREVKEIDLAATLKREADALEAAEKATRALADQAERLSVQAFYDQEGAIRDILRAREDLIEAEGEWIQVSSNRASDISAINAQLAADLSDDQRNAYREILSTVTEGSAEWLAAYSALQSDLTISTRSGLIARKAELDAAHGDLVSVYTGDAEAAEAAQERIDAANDAIAKSYREMVFQDMFAAQVAAGEYTKRMGQVAVALGLVTQEEANLMVEASNITDTLQDAITDYQTELDSMSPATLEEFIRIIASGETDSITGAMKMAIEITGDLGLAARFAGEGIANIPTGVYVDVSSNMEAALEKALRLREELERIANTPWSFQMQADVASPDVVRDEMGDMRETARSQGYQ